MPISQSISLYSISINRPPAGGGIHPYLSRHINSQVKADARDYWRNGPDGLACDKAPSEHLRAGRPVSMTALEGVDNFFEATGKHVIVESDGHRASIEGGVGFHLYMPAGADYFCVEPVNHAPNNVGRGEFDKSDLIDPGQSRRLRFRLGVN